MPEFDFTRARTDSPSCSRSAAVAAPVLIRKLQCFGLTRAPPMVRPRHPASSISFQAFNAWLSPSRPVEENPAGFLNVEPPVRSRIGCAASRLASSAAIRAVTASPSSARPWNTAPVKINPSAAAQWR